VFLVTIVLVNPTDPDVVVVTLSGGGALVGILTRTTLVGCPLLLTVLIVVVKPRDPDVVVMVPKAPGGGIVGMLTKTILVVSPFLLTIGIVVVNPTEPDVVVVVLSGSNNDVGTLTKIILVG
jgi:hypothetical protein